MKRIFKKQEMIATLFLLFFAYSGATSASELEARGDESARSNSDLALEIAKSACPSAVYQDFTWSMHGGVEASIRSTGTYDAGDDVVIEITTKTKILTVKKSYVDTKAVQTQCTTAANPDKNWRPTNDRPLTNNKGSAGKLFGFALEIVQKECAAQDVATFLEYSPDKNEALIESFYDKDTNITRVEIGLEGYATEFSLSKLYNPNAIDPKMRYKSSCQLSARAPRRSY